MHTMNTTTRSVTGLVASAAAAMAVLAVACAQAPVAAVPAALEPEAGARLALSTPALGVQIYECRARAEGGFGWAFVAPEAELFDAAGRRVGHHGAGPFWQGQDGSRVTASVKARADAPLAGAIPWLLLEARAGAAGGAASGSVDGVFAGITAIQRVHTQGGNAPAGGCGPQQAGQQARVAYTAVYHFYRGRA